MASDEENDYHSDAEINTEQHSRFLEDVMTLDKKQFVKKPTRTEPTSHVSEFNLVKSSAGRQNIVHISDLTKSLDKKKKHVEVSKKVKSAQTKVGTLRQPLEKPQRDRIKRSVGFKEVKLDLEKWDPIVTKNRVTTQLHFPLHEGGLDIHEGRKSGFKLKFKSKLDEELEKLEPVVEKEESPVESFPLTMKEILEKRREMARLRAQQSYQEAKYHRQNKIKSKKFHRILRKEKIKNQIKDFEKLQKTDPEEALKKLEEIERVRAEERMTLRHKSTGQWAKSKLVRAKYDKESRQVLAQQLAISRDLTQKLKADSSSESDEETVHSSKPSDSSNPWTNGVKTVQEIDDFVSGYRKFWEEKNKSEKNPINGENGVNMEKNVDESDEIEELEENQPIKQDVQKHSEKKSKKKKLVDPEKEARLLKKLQSMDLSTLLEDKLGSSKKRKRKTSKTDLNISSTSDWNVETLQENENQEEDIDEMFEDLDNITKKKLKTKLTKIKTDLDTKEIEEKPQNNIKKKRKDSKVNKKKSKTANYMELPREKYRPELDEELIMEDNVQNPLRTLSKIAQTPIEETNTKENADIDPNKYINMKPTHLDTFLPNNMSLVNDNQSDDEGGASDEGADQRDIITEAFAGDDVVADFAKDKKSEVEGDLPQDVDLTLPGWGSWAGDNIKVSKRKKRRFIIKFPKKMPRRDENKGQVIINETKNEKLNQHLVSEVPFPFRSVKDFEASIRAPIGDTFVPQTAFRRHIKPSIITKKGEIIKPMDDEVLVKNKFTKQGHVVKG